MKIRRAANPAISSSAADTSNRFVGPMTPTRPDVRLEPVTAPIVPPAPMNPKSRFPWAVENTSVMTDQNIETAHKLNTAVHTKKTRPAQTACASDVTLKRTKKSNRLAAKKRYPNDTSLWRGRWVARNPKAGLTAAMLISVPVNSHGRFWTPPATPMSSRIGRTT